MSSFYAMNRLPEALQGLENSECAGRTALGLREAFGCPD